MLESMAEINKTNEQDMSCSKELECDTSKMNKLKKESNRESEHKAENLQEAGKAVDVDTGSLNLNLEALNFTDENIIPDFSTEDYSKIASAFINGNDDEIQFLLTKGHATLSSSELDILFEKAVLNNNLAIVNRLLINQIDISKCLENCKGILSRCEGLKLRQYLLILTDENSKLNYSKLVLEDNMDLLHEFIESGPDVNVRDCQGYTCLQRVLLGREERLDVVKFLVEHGADINSKDPKGSPCLLLAATKFHFKICEYFITNGADVNCRNARKKTMLHLVSCKSRFYDTVSVAKFLVRVGADVNVTDDKNLTPIEIAAKEYNQRAVDYFATLEQVTIASKIKAFEIIGSLFNSKDTAVKYWTKVLVLKTPGDNVNDATVLKDTILPGIKCLNSIESVKQVAHDEETRLFYSVYLLDKVLGRHNVLTLKKLKTLARSYLKTERGEHIGSVVIKYALCKVLKHQRSTSIFKHSAIVDALYDILCCWCYYFKDKNSISFTDIIEIFEALIDQLEILGRNRQKVAGQLYEVPFSSLDLVYEIYCIIFALDKTETERTKFMTVNDAFLNVDERFCHVFGRSIIHTTVQNRIHYFFQADVDQKYEITRFLLSSGISVNTLDISNNTPMHLVLKESPNPERTKIVELLIENGGHVDFRNDAGETVLGLLTNYDIGFNEVKYRSLQCLCACVIKHFHLPYETEVPKHLKTFVDRH
ncbi:hypothetical protein KUTeg_021807 [Tegillarca granosa]|uniref:Uncharacterized protein n=1 Tax=Tegillarca granosa TaxID=220873 RepID=A0ABQ9E4F1_TEGGR|nr:hypothetical protein KUTeg_021807 [Tegillarca granosa]